MKNEKVTVSVRSIYMMGVFAGILIGILGLTMLRPTALQAQSYLDDVDALPVRVVKFP